MSAQSKISNNGSAEHRRPSISYLYSALPSQIKPDPAAPSTNKIILDYLLYLSIQSRLQQAALELDELASPAPEEKADEPEHIERRANKWRDTASRAERDKNAVESIVAGVLSDHRKRTPSSIATNPQLEQRLHLCQLTNLVFGRFDEEANNSSQAEHTVSARTRKHSMHIVSSITNDDQHESHDVKLRRELFAEPVLPAFCRRHRRTLCALCQAPANPKKRTQQTEPTPQLARPHGPGLIEAIPAFLKTSADWLRMALDSASNTPAQPMTFAGERVMGGGMPPKWYDLFLELLTQAVIEAYLCDSNVGLEPIFEAFSYGDVEEDEEEEDADESTPHDEHTPDVADPTDVGEQEAEDDEEEELWGVRAEDHFLLFPRTRTIFLFSQQLREREKEFLMVEGDLRQHFETLAERYPLSEFEKGMGDFIRMVLNSMDSPKLDKYEGSSLSLEKETASENKEKNPASILPAVYQFPSDGALLMPEVPDDDSHKSAAGPSKSTDKSTKTTDDGTDDDARGTKRRHSTVPGDEDAHKRK